jgi:hypothetical protein
MSKESIQPALGAMFATFWIRLIVRIINRHESWAIGIAAWTGEWEWVYEPRPGEID